MDFVDSKYIGLVSSRLQKFKRVKSDLYNFRCPICGDSQKNKNKTRGYLYPVKNNTNFKCHNCGASMSFNNFLKEIDTVLYKQYTMEKFKEGHTGKNFVVEEPKFEFTKPVFKKKLELPKASEVEIAKNYLEKRRLDPEKFYFANNFKEWTNTQKVTKWILRNPFTLLRDPSTPRLYKMLLLCVGPTLILGRLVGTIIFTFLITNLAIEKSSTESKKPSIEATR